ncbi:MAG: RNA methyltransferase [Mollicutes bacterium]|nr:RNA methyltransferase [Mollicutes bacterium]
MLYSSIENKKIKDLKKLQQKKYRDKIGLYLVEGEHLVLEAYKTGFLKTLILEENMLFPLNIETMYITNNIINYLSEVETPQPIMGVCLKQEDNDLFGDRILVLDGIQDPGNLGTIIRSAVAFNIDTIILSKDTVDLYNSKVIRACQGMNFHINIVRKDLLEVIPKLIEKKYRILGTRVTHGKNIKNIEKLEKFVIIMGNEGNGLSEPVMEMCDEFIYIEMNEVCESLNVGVATSIILYELDK